MTALEVLLLSVVIAALALGAIWLGIRHFNRRIAAWDMVRNAMPTWEQIVASDIAGAEVHQGWIRVSGVVPPRATIKLASDTTVTYVMGTKVAINRPRSGMFSARTIHIGAAEDVTGLLVDDVLVDGVSQFSVDSDSVPAEVFQGDDELGVVMDTLPPDRPFVMIVTNPTDNGKTFSASVGGRYTMQTEPSRSATANDSASADDTTASAK